jgi:hypothetical protein
VGYRLGTPESTHGPCTREQVISRSLCQLVAFNNKKPQKTTLSMEVYILEMRFYIIYYKVLINSVYIISKYGVEFLKFKLG